MCVCVRERERQTDRQTQRQRQRQTEKEIANLIGQLRSGRKVHVEHIVIGSETSR